MYRAGRLFRKGRLARLSCFPEIFAIRPQPTIVILKMRRILKALAAASAQPARTGQLRGLGGLPTNKQKDFLYRMALLAKERISGIVTLDFRHALSENPRLKMCARHRDIRNCLKINFLERTRKCRKTQRK